MGPPLSASTCAWTSAWTRAEQRLVPFILIVAAILLLTRLDDRFLWQDEAETALLAESVLVHGVPTAYDGRNLISQEGQQEFEPPDYRWFWTPWLQHYATAASFAILGPSTLSARLPFVLFGLGTILIVYQVTRSLSREPRVAAMASILLTANVPFLLHVRQCRYYAPACFFGVLLLWQYLRVREERRGAAVWLGVAATGLFHSHYVVCAGFVLGLALHFAIFDRRLEVLRRFILPGVVTILLAAPYLAGFLAQGSEQALPGLTRSLSSLREAVFHIDRYVFPFPLLIVAAGIWLVGRRGKAAEEEDRALLVTASTLPFIAVATVGLLVTVMPWFFFRYYVALIPIGAIAQALILLPLLRRSVPAAMTLAVILACTDLAGRILPLEQRIPSQSVRHFQTGDERPENVVGAWARFVPLAAYVYEIMHERSGPIEAAVDYLRSNTRPGDRILVTYGDLPIQFYTDLEVVGGLSGRDPAPFVDAEWLFVRAHTHRSGDRRLKKFIATRVDRKAYQAIDLPVLDVPYENRPDPTYHKFRSPSEGLPRARLWRRRDRDGDREEESPD